MTNFRTFTKYISAWLEDRVEAVLWTFPAFPPHPSHGGSTFYVRTYLLFAVCIRGRRHRPCVVRGHGNVFEHYYTFERRAIHGDSPL